MNGIYSKMRDIKLQYINDYFDGAPVWCDVDIKGFVTVEYDKLTDPEGNELVSSMTFILPPICPLPKPGNRIVCSNKTFDVLMVEIKRSITGRVAAYKCICGDI